ncbi:type II CAAX endopeptidase family protein [Saccharibacillus sp. CPCC 101409]|uniref:CPBP family intramembrane glutamic endopeptidase n=1 Tax=Saccharibacillus sp. CPCC 101409 TaxID=3058041 RepID=UPI0026726532|nr:type II CAAX endopeptidase family protein [Saccharibacillus sp. CPCC 101409]MDO3411718.1 type II CAAX endopeptidase family protein [Saccharibacillus sp. CPCC 101409]
MSEKVSLKAAVYLLVYAAFVFMGKLHTLLPFRTPNEIRFAAYALLFAAGAVLFRETLVQSALLLRSRPIRQFLLLIGFYIAYLLLSIVVYTLFEPLAGSGTNDDNVFAAMAAFSPWITLPVLGVMGPIVEEFVYRYLLIGRLSERVPVWACVSGSSLLFGLLHIHSLPDLANIVPYLATGLVLGTLYIVSGQNLLLPIIFHVFNNLNGLIPSLLYGS